VSHFSEIKASFKDAECLVNALVQLGFLKDQVKVNKTPVALRDYTGQTTQNKAHVVVPREAMGNRCSDIGWQIGEKASGYVDAYNNSAVSQHGGQDAFLSKVAQEYAVATISKSAKAKGKVAHRVSTPDGRVKVFCNA
jgi:hypothetical protein